MTKAHLGSGSRRGALAARTCRSRGGPWDFSQGERDRLARAGIGPAEYATILSQNPFAGGATYIDPDRFVKTGYFFNYVPVPTCADNGNASTEKLELKASTVNIQDRVHTESYSVAVEVASNQNMQVVESALKFKDTYTWTHSRGKKVSDGRSSVTTLQFGQPFCDYQGNTAGYVYMDTLYKTFLFSLEVY